VPAPSEEFPEEGVCEKSDCMKVGRGRHVGMEAGAGVFDVKRDTRSGRHSRSGHTDSATKRDHGEATMRIHGRKITPREKQKNLRAGDVWKVCSSMSSLYRDVYGIDEAHHAGLVRRLNGVMIAVEAAADVWSPDRMDVIHVGDAAVGAGTSTEDVGVVGGNGGFDERRRELRPKLNWIDSNRVGEVGKWGKHTQRKQMYSPEERDDPERKRGRKRQENGMKS